MAFVTGHLDVQNLAAELLTAVLHHPQSVIRQAHEVELLGQGRDEEWEVLTAVACSLRESAARGDGRQPAAEIHLLRHLAECRQPMQRLASGQALASG